MKKLLFLIMVFMFISLPGVSGIDTQTIMLRGDPSSLLSGTIWDICIDPGHGGPANGGGRKYGENGDYLGAYGYSDSLSEQWATLCVAFLLQEKMQALFKNAVLTRVTQYEPDLPPDGWDYRVNLINTCANGYNPADLAVVIHFNGLFPGNHQRTECFYSDRDTTDGGEFRVIDTVLPLKVVSSLHRHLNENFPCVYGDPVFDHYRNGGSKVGNYYVARNAKCAVAYVECSDISQHWDEEDFLEDSLGCHQDLIAIALKYAIESWENNSGMLSIRTKAICGDSGFCKVSIANGPETYFNTPLTTCLQDGEHVKVWWVSPISIAGCLGTVDYVVSTVSECNNVVWVESTQVVEWTTHVCSTHTITAYYAGGDAWYSAELFEPQAGEVWELGTSQDIRWIADPGVDSTSRIDILLSRDGGSIWETLFVDVPWDTNCVGDTGHVSWQVSGTSSADCHLKLVMEDMVGNQTEKVSDYFVIGLSCNLTWPACSTIWQVGDSAVVNWSASPGDGGSTKIDILYSTNGGVNWEEIATNLPNTGNHRFIVDSDTTNAARIKIFAHDSVGNSAQDVSPTFSVQYHLYVRWLAGEGMYFCMGWRLSLFVQFPPGSNGSSVATIYLSRDGGTTYEYLGYLPYPEDPNDYISRLFTWVVEGPNTDDARVYIAVTDDQGHTAEYYSPPFNICGGCVIGDLNKDGSYYDIADAVSMINYLLMIDPSFCEPDPTPCDIDCNGQLHVADFQWLVLIILGHRVPCDRPGYGSSKYAGEIEVESSNDVVCVEASRDVGAIKFTFDGPVNPQLALPNMQMKVWGNQIVVYSMSGHAVSPGKKKILELKRGANLLSAEAADCNGDVLKVIIDEAKPLAAMLIQNFPNPFNPKTVIEYLLPQSAEVSLVIYNVLGQKVKTLVDGFQTAGFQSAEWDGTNESGSVTSSGIYFYKLVAGDFTQTKKMVMLK